ncbi:uncharacterized protein LOC141910282 [Tubulanus polymorphus]|uniref:uncharacterized protein LOC141910282 n=1 Tax=Tubulanus polymorphus TaxID=672921 RepID=UPI003DA651F2
MRYQCKECAYTSASLKRYVQHYRLHRNVPNLLFPCGVPGCSQEFRNYSTFNSHVSTNHLEYRRRVKLSCVDRSERDRLICSFDFCEQNCIDVLELVSHLKKHIREGREVNCPFANCTFKYNKYRYHVNWAQEEIAAVYLQAEPDPFGIRENDRQIDVNDQLNEDCVYDLEDNDEIDVDVEDQQFLDHFALLLLRLQAKHHLPESVIQVIVDSFNDFGNLHNQKLRHDLKLNLASHNIPNDTIETVVETLASADCFKPLKSELKSTYKRKRYFKENFNYVEPVSLRLGVNSNNKEQFCHYVPIKDKLSAMLSDRTVVDQLENYHQSINETYRDIFDGRVYKNIELFQRLQVSLKIILYQDSFEVVNPLGSAKTKHKILAVYFNLANFLPHHRSKIDPMQLVLLCTEKNVKEFGFDNVLSVLVNDLKDLETNGISYRDGKIFGAVVNITGDNLGSHAIGGFVENFSGEYFCRYCLITRADLLENKHHAMLRTPLSYDSSLETLKDMPEATHHQGVKKNSIFNNLPNFHVCEPRLPPCLGHDLFEGVVTYDLAKVFSHMIKTKKWFTYDYLNNKIKKFAFQSYDAADRPSIVDSKKEKVGGHAVQTWCLLRNLPYLIGSKVVKDDQLWEMVILLRRIVEYICAPVIMEYQLNYLQTIIDEYLQIVNTITTLRPKHHFLFHYPYLIRCFGPLMRVWAMRFEQKHKYFKTAVRQIQNFINITKSLSERHELFQAYLMKGSLFPVETYLEKSIPFSRELYNDSIRGCIEIFEQQTGQNIPPHASISDRVCYNSIVYSKGLLVMIKYRIAEAEFGRIVQCLMFEKKILLIVECLVGEHDPNLGLYELSYIPNSFLCMDIQSLIDYQPLVTYPFDGKKYVALKHAIQESA